MAKRIDLRGLKVRHAIDRRMIRDCIRNYGDFEMPLIGSHNVLYA